MMTAAVPRVSILIPVYNGAPLLRELHRELSAVLDTLPGGAEIVFVDDGSTDESIEVLRALQVTDLRIRIIELAMNFGQHAAFSAALEHARGRHVVTMDADLQCDPRDIPALLAPLDAGFDFVSGVRGARRDPLSRRALSAMASRLVAAMSGVQLRDIGCPFTAMTGEIARHARQFGEQRRFLKPLLVRLARRVAEVPVAHRTRSPLQPRSSYSKTALLRHFMDFLATNLRDVFAWVFAVAGCLSVVLAGGTLASVVAWMAGAVAGVWVAVAAALTSFAVLVALLGLVGDYLQRIHRQSSGRPFYLIRSLYESPFIGGGEEPSASIASALEEMCAVVPVRDGYSRAD